MPQARGTQTTMVIADEETYGADHSTPDAERLYYTTENVQAAQPRIQDETLTDNRSRAEPGLGNKDVSGPINSNIGAEWIGKPLKHLMGDVTTTGAGPYEHVLAIGDLPVGFTLEKDFGSNITKRYEKFNGCRMASAQFSFPNSGPQTVAFNILGAKRTLGSSALDASVTDNGHTAFFSGHQSTIEEGGSAIATVTSAQFTLNNGLDTDTYVLGGDNERAAADEGFATISGELTALFSSDALLEKAVNDTETSLKIVLSRGDGLGSAGNESIEFLIQQMKYAVTSPGISGPAGILITLPFEAYRSGSDLGLQITLNNAVTAL